MLKELFEGHFYGTFPKVAGRRLNLSESVKSGSFSLLDKKACRCCRYVCDTNPDKREQMKVESSSAVHIISLDEVFSYVKEDIRETADYLMEGDNTVVVVEMTCSTTDYVTAKREKARRQMRNTLMYLMTSPLVKGHIERQARHYVVFSWKETFSGYIGDAAEQSMTGMTLMADNVYSPDNESKFDFGFKWKEIRYPFALVV